jgi:hypothetical protein
MRTILILAVATLAACTPTGGLTPSAQDAVNKACAKAAVLQGEALTAAELVVLASPLAGPDGNTVAQAVANGAAVDQAIVHPLVVDLCAKLVH